MGTKREELEKLSRGEGCLAKSAVDEPVFILVGRDASAATLVEQWAHNAAVQRRSDGSQLGYDHPKVREAMNLASAMRLYSPKKDVD